MLLFNSAIIRLVVNNICHNFMSHGAVYCGRGRRLISISALGHGHVRNFPLEQHIDLHSSDS